MKMSKGFYVILFVAATLFTTLFISSCTPAVRYTYGEIKHYPINIKEHIMKGEVALGMTSSQVRHAWGPPHSVRVLRLADDKRGEEWIYTKLFGVIEEKRLLFIDGKLAHISP